MNEKELTLGNNINLETRLDYDQRWTYHEIIAVSPDWDKPVLLFTTNDKRFFDYMYEGAITVFKKLFANFSPRTVLSQLPVEVFDARQECRDEIFEELDEESDPVRRFFEAQTTHHGLISDSLFEKDRRDIVTEKQVDAFHTTSFDRTELVEDALEPIESMFGFAHHRILKNSGIAMIDLEYNFRRPRDLNFFKRYMVAMCYLVKESTVLSEIDLDYFNDNDDCRKVLGMKEFMSLPYYHCNFQKAALDLTVEECRAFIHQVPNDDDEETVLAILEKNRDDFRYVKKVSRYETLIKDDKSFTKAFNNVLQYSLENLASYDIHQINIQSSMIMKYYYRSGYRIFFTELFKDADKFPETKNFSIVKFNELIMGDYEMREEQHWISRKYADYALLKMTKTVGAHDTYSMIERVVESGIKLEFVQWMELLGIWDSIKDAPVDWWTSLLSEKPSEMSRT